MREKKSAEEVSAIRRELALARWAKLAPPATASIRCEEELARLVREYARLVSKRASEVVSAALRAYFAEVALLQPDLYRKSKKLAGVAHSSGREVPGRGRAERAPAVASRGTAPHIRRK